MPNGTGKHAIFMHAIFKHAIFILIFAQGWHNHNLKMNFSELNIILLYNA